MTHGIRVDLHCHSRLSDGELSPEELAERLAQAGVAFAALTDHDTVEGLANFRAAADRRGIGCVTGLELTVRCHDKEAHLLAYGLDPHCPELLAILESLRHWRDRRPNGLGDVHSIATNLRQRSGGPDLAGSAAGAHGQIDIADAIALIHRAGGKAFLAHPLIFESDPGDLRSLLEELRGLGLDGIEAVYAPFSLEDQSRLCEMAKDLELLVCGGADQHQASPGGGAGFGVNMPRPLWVAFRQAVTGQRRAPQSPSSPGARPGDDARPPCRPHLRPFVLHIILPTVLAISLFVGTTFVLFLPTMERALLDRKREMIRELTNSAWSILTEAHRQERAGLLTRPAAQELAKTRVESMRYGREGKDYFWLQDMHPRIVMHPYRTDLNGQDVTEFRDPRGTRIFVEFADVVRRKSEGYVEYVWQWKDDPARLAPKESYIRGFEPWGWILGTGIYIEDVQQEIARIERNLVYASIAISVLLAALLSYVMRESLGLERRRRDAEQHLRESSHRYRSLVEAATEGTLLVLEGRCRYANPMLLEMLGYNAAELELMDLADLLGTPRDNPAIWEQIERLGAQAAPGTATALLARRDHSTLSCQVALRPIDLAGRSGLVLLARPSSVASGDQQRRAMIDRLVQIPEGAATDLAREVSQAPSAEVVAAYCRRGEPLVRSFLDCGVSPRHVTRMLASVCDAATVRLVELATRELGPSPVPFDFIALGSQGRQEQTLCTDQDNAIIYDDDGARVDPVAVLPYFRQLGQRVCEGLARAGYAPCSGGIMASNDRWCQGLTTWKRYFDQWIAKAEPRELLDFSIFFDLRGVFGQSGLASRLRSHVQQAVFQTPAFFAHFAANSLLFKPPLGLFGRIVTGGGSGDSAGMLDLKAAMMPIVSFARLYALKNAQAETGTLDRLAALAAAGVLLNSTQQEMQAAYEALMRLRLRHQCELLAAQRPPDNLIDPHALGHIERAILKESFTEIEAVQKRVSYDFLGGANV